MPHPTPLSSGDPRRVARYQLTGRLAGIPSDDPIFLGAGPDGTEVAISVLSGDWALDGAARDRFAAEATVAKRVPPFCAARVLDAGLDGSQAYLVSEYIAGQSLLETVAADGFRRGHDLEAIAVGMATGLASVHQAGLVHGNFGPEFVIMAADGSPRVVEFGITPPYGSATPSADMLAWAQTVVFAASGRPPATYDDLDVLPDHLRAPVEHCLEPGPGGRPSARAVVQSLLGSEDLPAGLLAEGSRRAARPVRGYNQAHRSQRPPWSAHAQLPTGQAVATQAVATQAVAPRIVPPRSAVTGTAVTGAGITGAGITGAGITGGAATQGQSRRTAELADGRTRSRHSAASSSVRHTQGTTRRGRRGGWLIAGGVAAAIAIGAIALHVVLGSGHTSSGRLAAETGKSGSSTSPSPTALATPSHGPVTPASFGGSWSGVVTQPPTDTYNVSVTLAAGTTAGTISYSGTGFSCSGALTLTRASTRKLVMRQGIIQGQSDCENGQVTITLTRTNKVWFSFHSTGPIASGSLARSSG
jgi:hypothetical protein